MQTTTLESTKKGSAAGAMNTNGAKSTLIPADSTTDQADEQRFAVGCWRYFDGCACDACDAADRQRKTGVVFNCDVCNDPLDAHTIAQAMPKTRITPLTKPNTAHSLTDIKPHPQNARNGCVLN